MTMRLVLWLCGSSALSFVATYRSRRARDGVCMGSKKKKLMSDLLEQAFANEMQEARRESGIKSGFSEMSRCFDLSTLKTRCNTTIIPSASELDRIAERVGAIAVSDLSADVVMVRNNNDFRLDGNVSAIVTQACVITNVPVDDMVHAHFTVFISQDGDNDVPFDQDDRLDVGELVLQYLCLEIDPYPRSVPRIPSKEPLASFDNDADPLAS